MSSDLQGPIPEELKKNPMAIDAKSKGRGEEDKFCSTLNPSQAS